MCIILASICVFPSFSSASAFAYGLFEGTGTMGECKHTPVHIESESIAIDRKLRFYTVCGNYVRYHKGSIACREYNGSSGTGNTQGGK